MPAKSYAARFGWIWANGQKFEVNLNHICSYCLIFHKRILHHVVWVRFSYSRPFFPWSAMIFLKCHAIVIMASLWPHWHKQRFCTTTKAKLNTQQPFYVSGASLDFVIFRLQILYIADIHRYAFNYLHSAIAFLVLGSFYSGNATRG